MKNDALFKATQIASTMFVTSYGRRHRHVVFELLSSSVGLKEVRLLFFTRIQTRYTYPIMSQWRGAFLS